MANSTFNSSLKKVSTIRLAPKIGGTMSMAVGTDESGLVASNCYVTFKQPSTASTADPYQIQYKCIYRYTAANQKKHGAEYNTTFEKASWKNAVAFGSTKVGSTSDPNTWGVKNRSVNTANAYQSILNLKNTKLASGYVAACYKFRIRTFNKKTMRHGSWVTSNTLTINRAASMEGDALHVVNGLSFGFNLNWDLGGEFVVDSVKVDGEEILASSGQRPTLKTVSTRTASTHPPKPADGYKGYDATVPATAFVPGGYEMLASAERTTVTAYWVTNEGVKTYFGDSAGAEMDIINEDVHVEPPRIVIDAYPAGGYVSASVYKGEDTDVIGKVYSYLYYLNKSNAWERVYYSKNEGRASMMGASSNPYREHYIVPLNTEYKVVAEVYDATTGGKASSEVRFSMPTRGMFMLNEMDSLSYMATIYGNIELSQTRDVSMSTYQCVGFSAPVVAFGGIIDKKITLKGTLARRMTAQELRATGYDDTFSTVEKWTELVDRSQRCMLRTPDGDMYTVVAESISISRRNGETADVTVTLVEVA